MKKLISVGNLKNILFNKKRKKFSDNFFPGQLEIVFLKKIASWYIEFLAGVGGCKIKVN